MFLLQVTFGFSVPVGKEVGSAAAELIPTRQMALALRVAPTASVPLRKFVVEVG